MCFLDCIRTIRHVISCKYTFFFTYGQSSVPNRRGNNAARACEQPVTVAGAAACPLPTAGAGYVPLRNARRRTARPAAAGGRGTGNGKRETGNGKQQGTARSGVRQETARKNRERRVAARTGTVQSNAGNASRAGCTGETPATPAESACQRNRSSHSKTAAEPYGPPPYERNPTGAHGS